MRIAAIAFKSPELISQYTRLHANAIRLAIYAAARVWPRYGQSFFVVTSVWYEGGSGVHADYRALDVSARDHRTGELLRAEVAGAMRDDLNAAWDHGSAGRFEVCTYHIADWGDNPEWHFHLQVRDATELKDLRYVDR